MNKLKQILLKYNIVEESEYLDKYCQLIEDNLTTKRQKFCTARHHVIPVSFYKIKFNLADRKEAKKRAEEDLDNKVINLTFADHLKAHLYLAITSSVDYKEANSYAFNRLISAGNKNFKVKISTAELTEQELVEYQRLQKAINKKRAINTKQQHQNGKLKMTDAQKQKLREASSGRISVVNKDEDRHYIKKAELQKYLDLGYIIGAYFNPKNNPHLGMHRSNKTKQKIKEAALKRKKYIYTEEQKKEIGRKLSLALSGKTRTKETCKKLQAASAALKSWTDGKILVRSKDCPGPNFYRGLPLYMRESRKGKKWYTNGVDDIIVLPNTIPPDGFWPGRTRTKK